MIDPLPILQSTFGFPAFRGVQAQVVERVLRGRAHARGDADRGGQVALLSAAGGAAGGHVRRRLAADRADARPAARGRGDRHPRRDADLVDTNQAETIARFRRGELDLLYVAPERASGGGVSRPARAQAPLCLFAIDEAHCVSEWGHDFRPDYRLLRPLLDAFPDVPRLALTATADAHTRADILEQLGIPHDGLIVAGFDRPNIRYRDQPQGQCHAPDRRPDRRDSRAPGIVYAQTRAGDREAGRGAGQDRAADARLSCRARPARPREEPGRFRRLAKTW